MADRPLLSVIIPCKGENLPGLARTLDSLAGQGDYAEGIEVLIVGDTHSGELPEVAARVHERAHLLAGLREIDFRYVSYDGGSHCWGQQQRQEGMRHARGEWLWFLADDDIATPNALKDLRACIARQPHPRPLFFRFVPSWRGEPIWQQQQLVEQNIDASCVVVPNVPHLLGTWGLRYEGDYDFASETAALWRGDFEWCDHVVCWARPNDHEDWTRHLSERGLRVNVGSGRFHLAGWVNLDSDPTVPADVHATVPPLPFADGSCAEVYCGHVLEHLPPEEGAELLRECHRVLEPGGRLGVVVPDTRMIVGMYLGGGPVTVEANGGERFRMADLDDVCRYFLFSTYQESPHRWAYDAVTLRRALEAADFQVTGEIDRFNDPRVAVGAWYQVGADAIKPKEGDDA